MSPSSEPASGPRPAAPAATLEVKDSPLQLSAETESTRTVIAWSSFGFALLQSICTAFVTLGGLRLALGISSLAISAGAGAALGRFHASWIRLPMLGLALVGSLANLAVLWQVRRLRSRPASRWRQAPVTRHRLRMERLQLALAGATLILIAVEEYLHVTLHHTF
jgi:hypothetical protein